MDDAILHQHVRLEDERCHVARGDELSGGIRGEVEVFTGSGDVSGIGEAGAINGRSVYYVVPQHVPKYGVVARDLRELAGGIAGGSEEGETANSVEIISDGDVLGGVGSSVPNGNLDAGCEAGNSRQLAVGLESGAEVTRVEKNSVDDVDVEVLILVQLHDNGVGKAVDRKLSRGKEGKRRRHTHFWLRTWTCPSERLAQATTWSLFPSSMTTAGSPSTVRPMVVLG